MATLRDYSKQVTPYSWEDESSYSAAPGGQTYVPGGAYTKVWDPEKGGYKSVPTSLLQSGGQTRRASGGSYPVRGGGGGRTTTTTKTPTMPQPSAPDIPAFTAPEYDEAKVKKLAQKHAAPSLRRLRSVLQQEMGRSYENPNVRAMTLREALQGYGLGVEGALSQAGGAARSEYGAEYQREYAGAMATYQTQQAMAMQSYQNAFNAYLQSMQQTTTTGSAEGTSGGWQASDFGPGIWAQSMRKAVGA